MDDDKNAWTNFNLISGNQNQNYLEFDTKAWPQESWKTHPLPI